MTEWQLFGLHSDLRDVGLAVEQFTAMQPDLEAETAEVAETVEQTEAQLVAVKSTFAPYCVRQVGPTFPPSRLPPVSWARMADSRLLDRPAQAQSSDRSTRRGDRR